MATISTPNDPSRDPNKVVTTANAGPQQQQQQQPAASTSGAPTGSGRFSTLQKYLQANQGAGQRIAGMVGGNIQREAAGLKKASEKETGEFKDVGTDIETTLGKSKTYQEQLQTPAQGQSGLANPSQAYSAAGYSTNLSGQKAIQDIYADEAKRNEFLGIRSGDTSAQLAEKRKKEEAEATAAAEKAYQTNLDRQRQLRNENERRNLITQALGSRQQRAGVQNLDNAFLSQDKNRTLNTLTGELQQKVGSLAEQKSNVQKLNEAALANLQQQGLTEKGIADELGRFRKEYEQSLEGRVSDINKAKQDRINYLNEQLKSLKANKFIDQDFADELELEKANRYKAYDGSTQDITLFNSLNDVNNINQLLDTSLLGETAKSGMDVINQNDLDVLSALSTLDMDVENPYKLSRFTGRQTAQGQDSAVNRINAARDQFLEDLRLNKFKGTGSNAWYNNATISAEDAIKAQQQLFNAGTNAFTGGAALSAPVDTNFKNWAAANQGVLDLVSASPNSFVVDQNNPYTDAGFMKRSAQTRALLDALGQLQQAGYQRVARIRKD